MVQAAAWADEIIKHITALYKKDTTHRERADVNAVIREMVLLFQQEAGASSVAIRSNLADRIPDLMADRVQLQQVFMNLMLNAHGMQIDYERSAAVVDAALDAGITLFDTADIYGGTNSEEFLGRLDSAPVSRCSVGLDTVRAF